MVLFGATMKGYELSSKISKLPFEHKLYKGIFSIHNLPQTLGQDKFIIVHRDTSQSGHW